jgi:ABC-type sugar transport system ATPase subunit
MIYVTHDQIEALTLADRIAVMRKASSSSSTTPHEIYNRPRQPLRRRFHGLAGMNFIEGDWYGPCWTARNSVSAWMARASCAPAR